VRRGLVRVSVRGADVPGVSAACDVGARGRQHRASTEGRNGVE
jgi:hypothetical protein